MILIPWFGIENTFKILTAPHMQLFVSCFFLQLSFHYSSHLVSTSFGSITLCYKVSLHATTKICILATVFILFLVRCVVPTFLFVFVFLVIDDSYSEHQNISQILTSSDGFSLNVGQFPQKIRRTWRVIKIRVFGRARLVKKHVARDAGLIIVFVHARLVETCTFHS